MVRQIYQRNHQEISSSLYQVATCYNYLNQYEKALDFSLQSLEINRQIYEGNNIQISQSLVLIAKKYCEKSQYKKALVFSLESLEMIRKIYKDTNQQIASSLYQISACYYNVSQYEKALDFSLKSLVIKRQIYYVISENDQSIYYQAQRSIAQYLQKNKLNWPISTYNFQTHIGNSEFKGLQDDVCLDQELACIQKTYEEYVKNYVPVFKQKFGTHIKLDIQNGEMKQSWSSFIRITLLEQILKQIALKSRNKDIFIILFMRAQEGANFTELKNEFDRINSRCYQFIVNTGNYDLKTHLHFASAAQINYSTEQLTHKVCYAYEQYFSGKDLLFYDQSQYKFVNQVKEDIIPDLKFQEIVDISVDIQQYP
ncbi:hypothetical protein ABPG72_009125 [Tetrahymena utriculariae]